MHIMITQLKVETIVTVNLAPELELRFCGLRVNVLPII